MPNWFRISDNHLQSFGQQQQERFRTELSQRLAAGDALGDRALDKNAARVIANLALQKAEQYHFETEGDVGRLAQLLAVAESDFLANPEGYEAEDILSATYMTPQQRLEMADHSLGSPLPDGSLAPTSYPNAPIGSPVVLCPAPTQAELIINVVMGQSQRPCAGAFVSVIGPSTRNSTTASDGSAIFRSIAPGSYQIEAAKTGYASASQAVQVVTQSNSEVTLAIAPDGSLSVRVVDARTHEAIGQATVTLQETRHTQRTPETGTLVFSPVDPGEVTVEVRHRDYHEVTQRVVIDSLGLTQSEVLLTRVAVSDEVQAAPGTWFPTATFPESSLGVCVVMAHGDYEAHATNLRRAINNSGLRTGGCKWCYEKLLNGSFGGSESALGAWWSTHSKGEKNERLGVCKRAHLSWVRARPSSRERTLNDLNWFWSEADRIATHVRAVTPANYSGPPARRLNSLQDALDFLRGVHDQHGPIQLVATLGHGGTSWADLGARLRRPRISRFLLDDGAADCLAFDVRWAFYACNTAGSDRLTPFAMASPTQFAAEFREVLATRCPSCETWGHLGPGDATRRPFWVRFRAEGAVSLFDYCDGNSQNWGRFRGNLQRVFEGEGFEDGKRGIIDIPMWPVGFEQSRLLALYGEHTS